MSRAPAKNTAAPSVPKEPRSKRTPRLTYVIASLDRILRRRMTEALAPIGLTLAQFTALSVLDARGEASNAQLAEHSSITPQSANEVMSAMLSRGWVMRKPDPNHGRIIVLQLTDEGRAIEQQMLGGVDAGAGAEVQSHLEVFVRNLRA